MTMNLTATLTAGRATDWAMNLRTKPRAEPRTDSNPPQHLSRPPRSTERASHAGRCYGLLLPLITVAEKTEKAYIGVVGKVEHWHTMLRAASIMFSPPDGRAKSPSAIQQ